MNKLKVLSLFAGIGGFDLGLERTGGFETVAFCEIEPFCQKVLAKHWPKVPCYHDIRTLTKDILDRDGIVVDIICGGFPCQDISVAGNRVGIVDGTRSGLWSEIVRLAGELRPQFIIVENVANLLSGPANQPGAWFGRILGDLAALGYNAEWESIPAAAVGAPHLRERIWIVSSPAQAGNQKQCWPHNGTNPSPQEGARIANEFHTMGTRWQAAVSNPHQFHEEGQQSCCPYEEKWEGSLTRPTRSFLTGIGGHWETEPSLGRVAHGVSNRMDRLGALGNAVVPQIPELIGNAILASLHPVSMKV